MNSTKARWAQIVVAAWVTVWQEMKLKKNNLSNWDFRIKPGIDRFAIVSESDNTPNAETW